MTAFFGFPGPFELLIIGLICVLLFAVPVIILVVVLSWSRKTNPPSQAAPDERKRCPECGEWIIAQAIKCRFCGATLSSDETK